MSLQEEGRAHAKEQRSEAVQGRTGGAGDTCVRTWAESKVT